MFKINNASVLFILFTLFIDANNCYAQKRNRVSRINTSADTAAHIIVPIRFEDYNYKPYIKTVRLRDQSFGLAQPILNLESDEKLLLSFDDLDADLKNYMYTIIHCNASWEADDLSTADYIDGFPNNVITDHNFSYNTIQRYTFYSTVFPNENMHITKSGNYLLKVYLDNDPDNIVITKRFMVFDNKVLIQAKVKPASLVEYRSFKQEIDFSITHTGYTINDPYGDLKIVITQNNRWDNAKKDLKPLFVKDDELVYDYDDVNVFDGGNEFRYIDLQSTRYHSERVKNITKDTGGFHVDLLPDEKRSFKRYATYTDMNGNYLVKITEGNNSDVEADYCHINFFLPYDDALTDGNLYVAGAFNDWRFEENNVMHYDPKRFGYTCSLYLKQGYYNYEYVFIKKGETEADQTLIEGMHYETENDYTIYVYHHQQSTYYDQLIGVKRLNSIKDR